MRRIGQVAGVAAVLTACAGPSAGGQAIPAGDRSLERIHLYEVPYEPIESSQTAELDSGWIQVSGSSSVQVAPDRARVAFAMETRAEGATEAASANADSMEGVLQAIRAGNFEGLELRTFGYSLQPEYAVNNNQRTREIVAYTALNNVGATITDVAGVGRVIDAAIGAGANRVASVSFFASNTDAARADALAQAVRNARDEAEIIAASLGHRLGAPLEINGGAQRPTPQVAMMAEGVSFRAASTPIEVGDQTVTASVSIRFALGPELGG